MRATALAVSLLACAGALAQVNGRQVPARADAKPVAQTSSVRSLYIVHCAGCHGRDGTGSTLGNVPDMRRLGDFLRVPGGREFVVSVPGVMGSGMNDAQVAEVTNWVLATIARESVPDGHRPYDAAEVARARAKPLADVARARGRLVSAARAQGVEIN
jgi:mono/diheme cytochrome c family protein